MEIDLVLGKKCNLKCNYCTHKKMKVEDNGEISYATMCYLQAVAESIVFYGGEPLVYWSDIVYVIENTMDKVYVTFTNGKALTKEKVKYLNKHKVKVILSWDGDNSEETRGYNAIAKNKRNILDIDSLVISSVVTNKTYLKEILDSLEPLEQEYFKKHDYYFDIQLSPLRENEPLPDMNVFDYDRLDKEVAEVIAGYNNNIAYKLFLDWVKRKYNRDIPVNGLDCGYGQYKLAIDRKGNYFACLGYDEVLGNVIETSIQTAINFIRDKDKYPERYSEKCADCEAQPICMNGCSCYTKEQIEVFCKLRQHIYPPIIQFFEEQDNENT